MIIAVPPVYNRSSNTDERTLSRETSRTLRRMNNRKKLIDSGERANGVNTVSIGIVILLFGLHALKSIHLRV